MVKRSTSMANGLPPPPDDDELPEPVPADEPLPQAGGYTGVDQQRLEDMKLAKKTDDKAYVQPPGNPPPAPPYGTAPAAGEPPASSTNPALAMRDPEPGTPLYETPPASVGPTMPAAGEPQEGQDEGVG